MLGTLTNFNLTPVVREVLTGLIDDPDELLAFNNAFRSYREDEVIGEFKIYPQVIRDSWQRTCNRFKLQFKQSDVDALLASIPTWGPHEDVVEPLKRLASKAKLVIFSNTSDSLVFHNADKLGVPFHRVFTAEQAQAYKPRLRAFEYMIDQCGGNPDEFLHVSAHIWYDVIPAHAMGLEQVYLQRGFDRVIDYKREIETGPKIHYATSLDQVADMIGA
jgi:2-haloacid dehalogenase